MRATVENNRPKGNIEEPEPDDNQAHDRARAERDAKTGVERFLRGVCRARARVSRGFHTEETRQAGEETSRQERHGNDGILQSLHRESGKQNRENHENDSDNFVLLFQIRHRAGTHVLRNLFHGRRAFIAFHHLAVKMRRECESHNRSCGNCPENGLVNNIGMHKSKRTKSLGNLQKSPACVKFSAQEKQSCVRTIMQNKGCVPAYRESSSGAESFFFSSSASGKSASSCSATSRLKRGRLM